MATNKEDSMFPIDTETRAGRMIQAGRVTVTFRSRKSGEHVTLVAKCRTINDADKWVASNLADAKVVFVEVPSADGGFGDKVGKVTRSKGFVPAPSADAARRLCAEQLLLFVAGQPTHPDLEIAEETRCGRCGRQLTDPVSIERGIGPECYGADTGSQHQAKGTEDFVPETDVEPATDERVKAAAKVIAHRMDFNESKWPQYEELARDVLEAASTASAPSPEAASIAAEQTEADEAAFPSVPAPSSDGKDKNNVPYGVGGWRARKTAVTEASEKHGLLETLLDGKTPGDSQLDELPGETFEDIFGTRVGRDAEQRLLASVDVVAEAHKWIED